jgi:hypothetical protein
VTPALVRRGVVIVAGTFRRVLRIQERCMHLCAEVSIESPCEGDKRDNLREWVQKMYQTLVPATACQKLCHAYRPRADSGVLPFRHGMANACFLSVCFNSETAHASASIARLDGQTWQGVVEVMIVVQHQVKC